MNRLKKFWNNRNNFSWIALVLLFLFEVLAFCGIHCSWCIWGPWALLSSLLIIILWIIGRCLKHKFNLRSVILTKLLANAIAPRRLGAFYLLSFVIHIGWLTNAVMNLFMPTDLKNVLIAVGICIAGIITIICFFPDGRKQKIETPKKVFVSGISAINYNQRNLKPLVSMLQLADDTDTQCELFILHSNYYSNPTNENWVNDNFNKYYEDATKSIDDALKEKFDKELANANDITEKLKVLIRIVASNMYPEKTWIYDNLTITFSEQADYNKFDSCFGIVNKFVKENDNERNVLHFNLTPGTGIVGSLMTLMAIDGDRSLYYYSQDNLMDESMRLQKVDKSQIPLHNLLSQALETLEDNNK